MATQVKDNDWSITLDNFYNGFSPLAFTDTLTDFGNGGHASSMENVDVLDGRLTQGPGLTALTGTLTESIQFIMDKAVSNNSTYAIGTANLFNLTATSFSSVHAITGCVEGESIQLLKGNLLYFYNTLTEGMIGKYDFVTYDDNWGTGLEIAPHPSDKKEDIVVFGNGRYAGVYIAETNSLTTDKLDFGNDVEVADVLYNAGLWYIAVNSGVTGTNRAEGQIYLYDGAALINTLTDETGVGMMRIGFLYRINGIVYVAYQDLSSTGFIIGYVNGKTISPLVRYNGTLPTFSKKTLYKNTLMFLSDNLVYCAGAIIPQIPFALSQIATSVYSTATAIACPFGTPIIASTQATSYSLAKFSGYTIDANWKSIVFPISLGKMKGYADEVVVLTKALGAGASCAVSIEANQGVNSGTAKTISTTGKTRHFFNNLGLGQIEDFYVKLDFSGGSTTNNVSIRSIKINGHFVEST